MGHRKRFCPGKGHQRRPPPIHARGSESGQIATSVVCIGAKMAARLGECIKHQSAIAQQANDGFGPACEIELLAKPSSRSSKRSSGLNRQHCSHSPSMSLSIEEAVRQDGGSLGGGPGRRELASDDGKGDPQFNIRVGSMIWQRANQVTRMFVLSCKSSATESYSPKLAKFCKHTNCQHFFWKGFSYAAERDCK